MDRLLDTLNVMSPSQSAGAESPSQSPAAPQAVLLDFLFPGFSIFSSAVQKYLHVDLNLYIPLILLFGGLTFVWQYFSEFIWNKVEAYLMSVVDIRTDDEIYNMLMSWVAAQRFSQGARRFVVNTNLSSRSWFAYRWEDDEDDDDETVPEGEDYYSGRRMKKKALAYTPTFGSHWFWYKRRLLIFRRTQNQSNSGWLTASEKEEISISCFGRNPWVLKELLHEARAAYMRRDEAKTLIYRGTTKAGTSEPQWQRSMSRTTRPFSTVILNEKVKEDLISDVADYLDPATRRWYGNRGIPYRRGYLLHGPPGTGKSSLSLALAGHFKMRIYIVSLSSVTASEENLATLFSELPRRCVVLLEDIDSAGLTHTRENGAVEAAIQGDTDMVPGQVTPGNGSGNGPAGLTTVVSQPVGRLSLSGLLNILDGVASQEGRVLIMTTNHPEKLDKALIRPGRVDKMVEFGRADTEMAAAIFRAIFAPLEGDDAPVDKRMGEKYADLAQALEAERARAAEFTRKREETLARVESLAKQFAEKIPAFEFSPAEIQGFLLKHKRSPEIAAEGAVQWVLDARKEKQEKELKDAEEKRKKEEKEKKEKEEKEKKEKEKEEKEEKEKEKKKEEEEKEKSEKKKRSKRKSKKSSRRKSRKNESDSSDSSSSSGSESESEAEASGAEGKRRGKSGEKKDGAPAAKHELKAAVVIEPPATLKTEISNRTVVADTESNDKLRVDANVEDGKQQGADSGYGTP